jgi:hypothetical protein
MSESQPMEQPEAAESDRVPDLDPRQEDQLTDLVYRLLRNEVMRERERSGERTVRR